MASEPEIFKQQSTLVGVDDDTLPTAAATDSALQRFKAPPTTDYDKINLHSTPKSSASVATQHVPNKESAEIANLSSITSVAANITATSTNTTLVATTTTTTSTKIDGHKTETAPANKDDDDHTSIEDTTQHHKPPTTSLQPGIGRGAGQLFTSQNDNIDNSPSPISQPTPGQRSPAENTSGVGRGKPGPGNHTPPGGRVLNVADVKRILAPIRGRHGLTDDNQKENQDKPMFTKRKQREYKRDDRPPSPFDRSPENMREIAETLLLCSTYHEKDEDYYKDMPSRHPSHAPRENIVWDPHKLYPYVDVDTPTSENEKRPLTPMNTHDREIELMQIVENLQVNVRDLLKTQQFHSELFTQLNNHPDNTSDSAKSRDETSNQTIQLQLQQFMTNMDQKLDQINDRQDHKLDQLNARLDRLTQSHSTILDDISTKIHTMVTSAMQQFTENIYHKIDTEVDDLRTQIDHGKKRVNAIGKITAELKMTSDDHTTRLDTFRQKHNDLQSLTAQHIVDLQSQINEVQRSTDAQNSKMAHHTERQSKNTQHIADLKNQIDELRENLAISLQQSDKLAREMQEMKQKPLQDYKTAPINTSNTHGVVLQGVYIPNQNKHASNMTRDPDNDYRQRRLAAPHDVLNAPRDLHQLASADATNRYQSDQLEAQNVRPGPPAAAASRYRRRSRSISPVHHYRRRSRSISPVHHRSTSPKYRKRSPSPKRPTSDYADLQQGYSLLAHKLTDLVEKFSQPKTASTPTGRDLPKVNTPTFTGHSDSSFEMWKASLEDMFAYLQWPPNDPMRLLLLPTALTDYAKIHYNSLPAADKVDYNTAMAALAKTFAVSQQTPTIKAAKLQRRQADTETVREYNLEITKRIQECNITDPERQLEIYMQNLRPDIAQRVLLMVPTSLRHAQTSAEIVEQSLSLQANTVMALNDSAPRRQDNQRMARADAFNSNRSSMSRDSYRSIYQNNRDNNRRSWSRDKQQQNRNRSTSDTRSPGRYQNNRDDSRNSHNRFSRSPTPYAHINALEDEVDTPPKN